MAIVVGCCVLAIVVKGCRLAAHVGTSQAWAHVVLALVDGSPHAAFSASAASA